MNIGKIIFGIIILALIPTHWFVGGIILSALTGVSGIVVLAVWFMLLLAGFSLIFAGLTEPDVVVEKYKVEKYPHKKEFDRSHVDVEIKRDNK